MSTPRFPPEAVAQIRQLHSRGMLNVRAWAQAYGVSLETVRRIARGDTYRPSNAEPARGDPQVLLPAAIPQGGEPDEVALSASFSRLAALQAEAERVPPAQDLLDELMARGKAQPGLPGVTPTEPARGNPPEGTGPAG